MCNVNYIVLCVWMCCRRNMLRVCRKEGTNNPDLWVQVLSYLVNSAPTGDAEQSSAAPSKGGDDDEGDADASFEDGDEEGRGGEGRWDDVRELLALIERDQVLSPLRVSECECECECESRSRAVALLLVLLRWWSLLVVVLVLAPCLLGTGGSVVPRWRL